MTLGSFGFILQFIIEVIMSISSSNDRPLKKRKIQHELPRKSKLTNWLTKYAQFLATPDAPIIFSR
jgi:hypothetical protein